MRNGVTIAVQVKATKSLIPGSKKVKADCGHIVWISPATAECIRKGIFSEIIKCMQCLEKEDDMKCQ